jgi:hypothetical protein
MEASLPFKKVEILSITTRLRLLVSGLTDLLDVGVLERLAESPEASPKTLAKLACNDDPHVRAAAADNAHTPYASMLALAEDPDVDVRFQLAENHNIPRDILKILSNDENPYIAERAQQTLQRQIIQMKTLKLMGGMA